MNYCVVSGNYPAFPAIPTPQVPVNAMAPISSYPNATTSNCYDCSIKTDSPPSPSCDSAASNPSVELMQMNGRKVLGPPEDWVGSPPTSVCELYVRRIPKDLNENKLLAPFLRFGRIYEIRLPMDFNQSYRGYAYVKYTNEEDAARAMEVLNHYYILPGRKLEILHSYEKCRLFISNIPKYLDEKEIEEKLRWIFPSMQRIYSRPNSLDMNETHRDSYGEDGPSELGTSLPSNSGNRGHVFVHFPSHIDALEAKKNIAPGLIRLWDRDLKVVWANTERESTMPKTSKTLFVRNVDLTVNNRDIIDLLVKHVPRTDIRKISKVRTTAFFDFTTREAAEICLKQLQGVMLRGRRLDVEWAKPSEQQSLHRMRDTDFDAVLRLKCIANGWHIPVIIFGCYYERERLQYGVVVLRDAQGNMRATFCILNPNELVDIHSRMCEVVCVLIETIGAFPDYNYVFIVDKDSAHLLGMVTHNVQAIDFLAACGVPTEFYFDLNEIFDLSWAANALTYSPEDILLSAYKESFRTNNDCTYLKNWPLIQHRIFGTIMPKYRNKPPLRYNLNDTQIVLALCFKVTGSNAALPMRPFQPFPASAFDQGYDGLRYVTLKLLPVALTQSRFVASHILSHVQFGGSQYYHPAQRIMLPPMWISGCTYAESITQPQGNATNSNQATFIETHQPQMQTNVNATATAAAVTYCHQQQPQPLYLAAAQQTPPAIMGTMATNTNPSPLTVAGGGMVNFVPNIIIPNITAAHTAHGYAVAP